MSDETDKAALKAERKAQKQAEKVIERAERRRRAEEAGYVRTQQRRQLMQKANTVCEHLGISSYTPTGNDIYQKALTLCPTKSISVIVATLQSDSLLEQARIEHRPEPYRHHLKEEFLGDESAASLRSENRARWDAARKSITDNTSKGLTFGMNLQRPKGNIKETPSTPAPVVEVVAPVAVPAPMTTPEQRDQFAEFNPAPVPSGLLVAGQNKAVKHIEGLPEVIRARIPGGLVLNFRKFVMDHLYEGLTADELADCFLTKQGLMQSVTEQASISVPDVQPATVEQVTIPPLDIPQHVDTTDYTAIASNEEVSTQSQRNATAQKAFRDAVMANCYGRCLISGKTYQKALQACHIQPHAQGGKMQVCNGLLLETSLHDVFDAGDMAIHPVTLHVYFSRAALDGGFNEYHDQVIGKTQIALGAAELVSRWESFKALHGDPVEF